jgi:hypothetical protein
MSIKTNYSEPEEKRTKTSQDESCCLVLSCLVLYAKHSTRGKEKRKQTDTIQWSQEQQTTDHGYAGKSARYDVDDPEQSRGHQQRTHRHVQTL